MVDDITEHPTRPATDAEGDPVKDPTSNVLDLVNAAIRRQDDLRQAEKEHTREMTQLRDTIADIREKHAAELRQKEADRLDEIRKASEASVQRSADVQQTQATALATQVVATADAFAARLVAALEPIMKDVADLRKTQYEQAGQREQTRESGMGSRAWIGIVIGAAAIVVTLLLR